MRLGRSNIFFRIARICAMFFIGLAVSLVIALSQVDLETMRGQVVSVLNRATGMPVEVRGNIKWKFSLTPRVSLSDVVILSKDWAKNKEGVRIEAVEAKINLLSFIRGTTSIRNLALIKPVVYLEENSKGEFSLESSRRVGTTTENGAPAKFPFDTDWGIDSILVENAKVIFIDEAGKTEFNLDEVFFKYKKTNDYIEYSGFIALDGQEYSFIASLSPLDAERKVYPVRVAIASKLMPIVANIALEQTSKLPIDFIIKGKIPDAQAIAKYLDPDFPKIAPITINLSGGVNHHERITLHQSTISFGKSDLSVSGTFNWSGKKPNFTAKLKSKKFILGEVFPDLYGGARVPWKRPNRELNVFKDTPLYSEYLNLANGEISLDFASLNVYRNLTIENIDSNIKIKDGDLSARMNAKFARGNVKAVLSAFDDNGVLVARGAGRGTRIVTGDILKAVGESNVIKDLPVDFDFYLHGYGRDLSALMASVTGPIHIRSSGEGMALPDAAEYIYGADFLTTVRHNVQDLVTNKNRYDKVAISCAVVNLKVRNGVVETEKGVAVQTSTVNMRLAGTANLGKETLNASFVSTPVRGLKISISGNIVNAMEFTGNMAEPDLKINGSSLIGRAATATGIGMLLAPFTGGLSIVAGAGVGLIAGDLLTNWLADDHPCRTASERGAPAMKGDPEFMNRPLNELVQGMGI